MRVEGFVAGILVIGLVVWGASVLATPGDWAPSPEAGSPGEAAGLAAAPEGSSPDATAPAKSSTVALAGKIRWESKSHGEGKGHAKKAEKGDDKTSERWKGEDDDD